MPKAKGEGRITAQNMTNFKVNLRFSEAGSVGFLVSPLWRSHQFMGNLFHWLNTLVIFFSSCPDGVSLATCSHVYCSSAVCFQEA